MTLSLGNRPMAALGVLAEEADAALKPLRPGTNGLKGLQLDGRFVSAGDGSLPATPDPQELGSDTRQLLLDFYRTHTGMSLPDRKRHHALPTMKRVVADVVIKHQITYRGMLQHLQLDSQPDDLSFIGCIAKTMFRDDTTNWGRIVSLVAFGAVVCSRLKELQRERCVETVAQQISSYLISEQHDWLLNNKGWHGFVEFFRVEDVESVVRSALMAVVGCAGIGAGLALLIR
ncbi:induced myeloid leukemia cell differentiation protein Mcl-1 homolog isoform X1 [Sinocyclocheilus anshuiensis]|uniref:Induced myeloid leukemia cell differentiation protein Mcl-1 homolog n=1 Tax=Sinocyclocheilus anshuiensis TaxID=1608454 RepID=A0A671LAP7_9TELE|nr:PREDICTED: induced myeloid leukemia cell differentiation protein Mcl-1 homolog isoform X1 [Sinocyclocheilus anshuiensis]